MRVHKIRKIWKSYARVIRRPCISRVYSSTHNSLQAHVRLQRCTAATLSASKMAEVGKCCRQNGVAITPSTWASIFNVDQHLSSIVVQPYVWILYSTNKLIENMWFRSNFKSSKCVGKQFSWIFARAIPHVILLTEIYLHIACGVQQWDIAA